MVGLSLMEHILTKSTPYTTYIVHFRITGPDEVEYECFANNIRLTTPVKIDKGEAMKTWADMLRKGYTHKAPEN